MPGVNTDAMPMMPLFCQRARAGVAARQVEVVERRDCLGSAAVEIDGVIGNNVVAAGETGHRIEDCGNADRSAVNEGDVVRASSAADRQVVE